MTAAHIEQVASECRLLGGAFASFIQVCLATLCITTLAFKRYGEVPQRPWVVWALDVGKQSVGSSFGHFSNIFLSEIIASVVSGGDECQWYCLSFVLDSTLGTFANLTLLHFVESAIHSRSSLNYLQFGNYGDPPSLERWTAQLAIWLTLVIIGKVICVSILLLFSASLNDGISYIFQNLRAHPQSELIVVMIIVPGIFNVISFWITDTFLKQQVHTHEEISQMDTDDVFLEMRSLSNDADSNDPQRASIVIPLVSKSDLPRHKPSVDCSNRNRDSMSSLLSDSSPNNSPSSARTLWQSAVKSLPNVFASFSTKFTGTSRGYRKRKSGDELIPVDKQGSDETL